MTEQEAVKILNDKLLCRGGISIDTFRAVEMGVTALELMPQVREMARAMLEQFDALEDAAVISVVYGNEGLLRRLAQAGGESAKDDADYQPIAGTRFKRPEPSRHCGLCAYAEDYDQCGHLGICIPRPNCCDHFACSVRKEAAHAVPDSRQGD